MKALDSAPRIVWFLKEGTFSNQNSFIEAQLSRRFSEYDVRSFDFWSDVVSTGLVARILCQWEALLNYPKSTLGRMVSPRVYATRTRWARKTYLRRVARYGKGLAFTFQTQSIFNASIPGVPHFVYTDHTFLANERYVVNPFKPEAPRSWVAREACIYRTARSNLTTSTFCSRSIVEDYSVPSDKVRTVYCGANAAAGGSERTATTKEKQVILFLGFDWVRKGGPDLVEAFRLVQAAHPQVELWIAGPQPTGGMPQGVKQLGPVSLDKGRELLASATLFCLPSLREPSAVVLGEALSHGLPIVATDVGGTADRVINGITGYLVPPCRPDLLATALNNVLSSSERAHGMGRAAKDLFEEHFSWDAVGQKISAVVRNSLGMS